MNGRIEINYLAQFKLVGQYTYVIVECCELIYTLKLEVLVS